mgnify:CR=1 FL=1
MSGEIDECSGLPGPTGCQVAVNLKAECERLRAELEADKYGTGPLRKRLAAAEKARDDFRSHVEAAKAVIAAGADLRTHLTAAEKERDEARADRPVSLQVQEKAIAERDAARAALLEAQREREAVKKELAEEKLFSEGVAGGLADTDDDARLFLARAEKAEAALADAQKTAAAMREALERVRKWLLGLRGDQLTMNTVRRANELAHIEAALSSPIGNWKSPETVEKVVGLLESLDAGLDVAGDVYVRGEDTARDVVQSALALLRNGEG